MGKIEIISREKAESLFCGGERVLCGCYTKKYGGGWYVPDSFADILKRLYACDKKVAFAAYVALVKEQMPHSRIRFALCD